jgi:hypothetical protein
MARIVSVVKQWSFNVINERLPAATLLGGFIFSKINYGQINHQWWNANIR